MTAPVQLVAVLVSLALLLVVLELVRRRWLSEDLSLLWLAAAALLLVLSLWREILHRLAAWLGVFYPPALLLLSLVFLLFVGLLCFSVVVSRQRRQIEDLAVEISLLDERLRVVETARGEETGGDSEEGVSGGNVMPPRR